jgi:hypothetical protein
LVEVSVPQGEAAGEDEDDEEEEEDDEDEDVEDEDCSSVEPRPEEELYCGCSSSSWRRLKEEPGEAVRRLLLRPEEEVPEVLDCCLKWRISVPREGGRITSALRAGGCWCRW